MCLSLPHPTNDNDYEAGTDRAEKTVNKMKLVSDKGRSFHLVLPFSSVCTDTVHVSLHRLPCVQYEEAAKVDSYMDGKDYIQHYYTWCSMTAVET